MAWKLAVAPEDTDEIKELMTRFLTAQQLVVKADERIMGDMPVLRASAGACRMLIAKVSSVGSNRDVIRSLASPGEQVFTVFEGKIYSEQPTTRTVTSYLLSKVARELGFTRHIIPVFAVVASPECNAPRLPWEYLRDLG